MGVLIYYCGCVRCEFDVDLCCFVVSVVTAFGRVVERIVLINL